MCLIDWTWTFNHEASGLLSYVDAGVHPLKVGATVCKIQHLRDWECTMAPSNAICELHTLLTP